jgi:hypothetical protein
MIIIIITIIIINLSQTNSVGVYIYIYIQYTIIHYFRIQVTQAKYFCSHFKSLSVLMYIEYRYTYY